MNLEKVSFEILTGKESVFKINAMLALEKTFVHRKLDSRSHIFKILFELMKRIYRIKDNQSATIFLFNFCRLKGINSLFKNMVSTNNEIINLVFIQPKESSELVQKDKVSSIQVDQKSTLLKSFKKKYKCSTYSKEHATRDEIIRFLNAMMVYDFKTGRTQAVLNDTSYNFLMVRNPEWIKNRRHSLPAKLMLDNEFEFYQVIKEALEWNPGNFPLDQRLAFFDDYKISMTSECLKDYVELLKLDIDAWWDNKTRSHLYGKTPLELFKLVIAGSNSYNGVLDKVNTWDKPFTTPPSEPFRKYFGFETEEIDQQDESPYLLDDEQALLLMGDDSDTLQDEIDHSIS